MNDLNRPADILKREANVYPAEVRQVALSKASDAWLAITAKEGRDGPTGLRLGLEGALDVLHKTARAALRKSETESSDDYSNDFSYPPTPGQAASASARAIQVQAIATAAAQRADLLGVDASDEAAMDSILRAVVEDHSYGRTESLDQLSARSAASARENGGAWPRDLADPRAVADADEVNAANDTPTNFSGDRGLGYTHQRSEMPGTTGFSSADVRSVPAGGAEGATVADASIEAIAQRAFEAGVAAGRAGGASSFSKAARQRELSAARRRG